MKCNPPQIHRSPGPLWGIDGTVTCIVPPATHKGRGLRKMGIALLFWLTTASAQITLNGNLLTDAEKPVPDTKVGVAAGPSNNTDSKGQFSIKLSLDFIEGERVFLVVEKPNWVINYPLDGEWNLPAQKLQEVPEQYTKVIIVPKGSKALWTHTRIEKHVALLSDEIAKLKKEGDTPKPIDFTYYLSEWAKKYSFTPDQVKAAFDQWANAVKDSTDKRTKGLREFYLKNFAKAAALFEEAALEDEADLKEIAEALRQKTLRAYANWKDAGNSLSNLLQFEDALAKYQKASALVPKEGFPQQWAENRILLGNTKREIGIRTGSDKANLFLKEAESAFREAFDVYTREQLPQDWAGTQNNLGLVYNDLGTRTGGEEGAKWLAQAVTAFQAALEVRSFEYLPVDWAQSQDNLAKTYILLEDWPNVAACFANVLKVYPRYAQAYQTAGYLYHETLFNFREAFILNQNWLAQFPDDLSAQSDFAEKHFTTSRFAECEQRLAGLLANAEIEPRVKIALRAIGIANALAQNKTQQVPAELETLQQNIVSQPDTFKVGWSFEGTKHFISTNEKLAPQRAWLLQFFAALERKEGREAILAGVEEVREKFKP